MDNKVFGKVTDFKTGEPIVGATVYFSDKDGKVTSAQRGTATKSDGTYEIPAFVSQPSGSLIPFLPEGSHLTVKMLGYETRIAPINKQGLENNFRLAESSQILNEVVVTPSSEQMARIPKSNEKKKNKTWVYIGASLGLLAIIGGVVYYYSKKK
jgi:hypothetical protein